MRKSDTMYRRHNGANIRIDPPKKAQRQRRQSLIPTMLLILFVCSALIYGVFLIAYELRGLR